MEWVYGKVAGEDRSLLVAIGLTSSALLIMDTERFWWFPYETADVQLCGERQLKINGLVTVELDLPGEELYKRLRERVAESKETISSLRWQLGLALSAVRVSSAEFSTASELRRLSEDNERLKLLLEMQERRFGNYMVESRNPFEFRRAQTKKPVLRRPRGERGASLPPMIRADSKFAGEMCASDLSRFCAIWRGLSSHDFLKTKLELFLSDAAQRGDLETEVIQDI